MIGLIGGVGGSAAGAASQPEGRESPPKAQPGRLACPFVRPSGGGGRSTPGPAPSPPASRQKGGRGLSGPSGAERSA